MKARQLTTAGRQAYREWLLGRGPGELPPTQLLDGAETELYEPSFQIDPTREFETRFDFGKYIMSAVEGFDAYPVLAERSDGLWDWITVVYFSQFGLKQSREWHYTVTRKGHSGSLAYRHLARTSFEMYWRHNDSSRVMLSTDMATWGDLSEQLTSRQDVAYHRGYIRAAAALYLKNGKAVKGAAGRVPPKKKRAANDVRGRGGVARLALAVRRLSRTFDTHVVETEEMLQLLPKEFAKFV